MKKLLIINKNMNKCIICNGDQKDYLKGTDFWLKTTKKEYNIIKCNTCGLEQISPTPGIEEISSFYKSNYYSYKEDSNESLTVLSIREKIFNTIHSICGVNKKEFNIKSYVNGEGKNFLDIGCGNGNIVKLMEKYGYNSDGFEIGENGKKGNIFFGDSIVNIDFGKSYDIIYISHVFEHINNPIEFLNKLEELLSNGGKCIILIPNINCFSSKIFKQFAMERDIPRHLYNYNYNNLDKLLQNNGFNIESKSKLRQYSLFDSLNLLIKTKYNKDIGNNIIGKIFRMFTTLFIENILNMIKSTNQMGFIISKK